MHSNFDPGNDDWLAIRQAARQVSQLFERHLAPSGVTLAQFLILRVLHRSKGTTMRALAELTSTDRTTLVRTLKPLLSRALIVADCMSGQRRYHVLTLTEAGLAKLEEALPYWSNAHASFERQFGANQVKALRSELLRLKQDVVPT
jgi:DNA-binding MarR family transcriptional regulator